MLLIGLIGIGIATADIGKALRQGDCQKALIAPDNPKPHHQLGLARCQLLFGNLPAARALLGTIEGDLQEYATLLSAEIDIIQRRYTDAIARLQKPMIMPGLESRRRYFLGKVLLAEKRFIEARDTLRGLISKKMETPGYVSGPNENDPAEIRFMLASGAMKRGRPDLAEPLFWKIWTDNPNSSFSEKSATILTSKGHRIPNSTTEIGRDRILKRARTFQKRHMHKQALTLLRLLPLQTTDQWHSEMANACFKAKDYPCAIKTFGKIKQIDAGDQFRYALATTRTGDYNMGAKRYADLVQRFPTDKKRTDLATFKIAYLKYDKGELKAAITLFKKHMAAFPDSRKTHSSLWFMGWSQLRLNRALEARRTFKILLKRFPTSRHTPAALYWTAKSIEKEKDKAKALPYYRALLKTYPSSGYAYFAAQKTGKTFPRKAPIKPNQPPSNVDIKVYNRGVKLALAGFDKWARDNLRSLEAEAQKSIQGRLSLAHALILAGDYVRAKRLFASDCREPWKIPSQRIAQICSPKPHAELIEELTKDKKIPPLLPFAIMTAESGMKPWVTSPAGARGLMQLMPYVAERKHMELFNTAFDPDMLFNAGYNAKLGVTELNSLSSSMVNIEIDDRLPLIIAGYNGGEKAVRRWVSEFKEAPTAEEFSANISYTETRKYVQRVLGYYMTYRLIYGD